MTHKERPLGLIMLIIVFITSLPILSNTLPETGVPVTETSSLGINLPLNNSWSETGDSINLTSNGNLSLNDSTEGIYMSDELTGRDGENESFTMDVIYYNTSNIRLTPETQARTINLTVQTSPDNFTTIQESKTYKLQDGMNLLDVSNFSRSEYLRVYAEFNSYATDDSPYLYSLSFEGTRYIKDRIGGTFLDRFIFLSVLAVLFILLAGWASGTRRI